MSVGLRSRSCDWLSSGGWDEDEDEEMTGSELVREAREAEVWLSTDDSVLDRPSIRFVIFVGVAVAGGGEGTRAFGFVLVSTSRDEPDVTFRRFVPSLSSSLGEVLRLAGAFLPYVLETVAGMVVELKF